MKPTENQIQALRNRTNINKMEAGSMCGVNAHKFELAELGVIHIKEASWAKFHKGCWHRIEKNFIESELYHNIAKLHKTDRFWSKVETGESFECWDWQAATDSVGHGRYNQVTWEMLELKSGKYEKVVTRQVIKAHTAAYIYVVTKVPHDLTVIQTCRNPLCCNPLHLDLIETEVLRQQHQDSLAVPRKGSAHPMSKLTETDIARIFKMRKGGMILKNIAGELGCSVSTVSKILRKKSWRHTWADETEDNLDDT